MSSDRQMVFHEDVVDLLLRFRRRERKSIQQGFAILLSDPYRQPDFQELDQSLRPIQVLVHRDWAISYWLDNHVKEIRIVSVEHAGT